MLPSASGFGEVDEQLFKEGVEVGPGVDQSKRLPGRIVAILERHDPLIGRSTFPQ